MRKVQNWRDYLDDPDPTWKQKITKKSDQPARQQEDREEFVKRSDNKRVKRGKT